MDSPTSGRAFAYQKTGHELAVDARLDVARYRAHDAPTFGELLGRR